MGSVSTGKQRKIVKNNLCQKILFKKQKSLNSLSKELNININSLRRVNVLTTPLATIWQLSKAFGTTIEGLLGGLETENIFCGKLNQSINNQAFIPFVPAKYFFEFLINPKEFLEHQDVFFFTHHNLNLTSSAPFICTFLKEHQKNKKKHHLAIIELKETKGEFSVKDGDLLAFKHNKYHSLLFGTYIKSEKSFKIVPQKVHKKPTCNKEDVEIIGKVSLLFDVNIHSKEDCFFTPLNDFKIKSKPLGKEALRDMRKECSRIFFQNVTKILKEKRISLNHLSRVLGKNASILHEAKKKSYSIRIETAVNIAKFLNTKIDKLLFGLEKENDKRVIISEKINKHSKLVPLVEWVNFERQAYNKHYIFSAPKMNRVGNIFAVKNNLEQSFSNGFHKDEIFIIFGDYCIQDSKHVMLQYKGKLKIAKVLFDCKKGIYSLFFDAKKEIFSNIEKNILGEIKYSITPSSKIE